VGAPNLVHGFSPQETISDRAKQRHQSEKGLLKTPKRNQKKKRDLEAEGLRMREVK
jgi:hypothetical protein